MDPKFSHATKFNRYQAGRDHQKSFENFSSAAPAPARTRTPMMNTILAALPDYELVRLLPKMDSIALAAGEEISSSDDSYVYFPESAVISHLYMLADGNTVEVAMIGSEGVIGACSIFDSSQSAHYIRVIAEGTAMRIKATILNNEFAYNRQIQSLLLNYLSAHLTQISQKSVCKSFHVIESRFCTWLLMLHDRAKRNRFSITQEQMSLFVGVYRPTITLVAKSLKDRGLIDYKRGKVSIINRQGLEDTACECYLSVNNM